MGSLKHTVVLSSISMNLCLSCWKNLGIFWSRKWSLCLQYLSEKKCIFFFCLHLLTHDAEHIMLWMLKILILPLKFFLGGGF